MRIPNFTWLIATLFLLSFSACQQEPPVPEDSLLFIPENTPMVTAIRVQQLMDKADFETIQASEGYKEMLEEAREANSVLAKVMEEPEASGIDLDKNIYLSMEVEEKEETFTTISMSIADAKAFEALVEAMEVEALPASQGYRYAAPGKHSVLAWNESVALIGIQKDGANLKEKLETYLQTPPEKSVAQNLNLRQALTEDFDIVNWISSDFLLESEAFENSSIALNYDKEDLKGNYLQHFLAFEKGEIISRTSLDFKSRIANDLGMMFRDNPKTDFTKVAPKGQPLFMLTSAFDMDGINQLLVEKYSKGLAEGGLAKYGISTNTLLKALNGDIMLAAYASETEDKKPVLAFAAKVKDEEALQSIFDVLLEKQRVEKISENRYRLLEFKMESKEDTTVAETKVDLDGQVLVKDGILYITSQPALLDKVEQGETGMEGPVAEQAKGLIHQNIFTAIGDLTALEGRKADPENPVESVQATAERGGTKAVIKLKDKNTNSLKALIDMMKKEAEGEEEVRVEKEI